MAIEYTLFKSQEFKKKVIANLKGSTLCNFAIEKILDGIILFENEKDNTTAFVVVEDGKTYISIPSRFEKEKIGRVGWYSGAQAESCTETESPWRV